MQSPAHDCFAPSAVQAVLSQVLGDTAGFATGSTGPALDGNCRRRGVTKGGKETFMTTAKLELLEPAQYNRTLKTELASSDGQPLPLRYIYDRSNKQPAVVFVGPVAAGMVTLMKKADPGIKVLSGFIAETESAILFSVGSQLTDKFLKEQLVGASIRTPVSRVKDVQEALDLLAGKTPTPKPPKPTPATKAPAPDEGLLLEKAEKAFAGLKSRVAVALKKGADNHKTRLAGALKEYAELVQAKSGKEALLTVVSIGKVLTHIESANPLLDRVVALEEQRDKFKNPPLHPKHLGDIGDAFEAVRREMSKDTFDEGLLTRKLDAVEALLEKAGDLVRTFRDEKSETDALDREIAQKDRGPIGRDELAVLAKQDKVIKALQDKAPKALLIADRYEPFTQLIAEQNKLLDALRKALKPKTTVDRSTLAGRKSIYAYNDSSTWVMNDVKYRNGTSSSSMSSQQLDLLKQGLLKSNTTAGGSVLKVGYEGHTHLNGGSGGLAFVYQLDEAEYKVTPIVVDTASSRGNNKDKNKYHWNTGGLDYFPPNAKY